MTELCLELGGVPLAIEAAPGAEPAVRALGALCARFLACRPATWRLRWMDMEAPQVHGQQRVDLWQGGRRLHIRAGGFSAWLDPSRREGELRGRPLGASESCLLAAVAHEDEQILPLHGSAVELGKEIHVFCGPSGSGKSTLAAALGAPKGPLADEIVLLRRERARADWTVHGTPFWQGRAACGPLAALHLLGHGRLAHRRLTPTLALARLLPELRLMLPAPRAQQRGLAQACQLLSEAPAFALTFDLGDVPHRVERALALGDGA